MNSRETLYNMNIEVTCSLKYVRMDKHSKVKEATCTIGWSHIIYYHCSFCGRFQYVINIVHIVIKMFHLTRLWLVKSNRSNILSEIQIS